MMMRELFQQHVQRPPRRRMLLIFLLLSATGGQTLSSSHPTLAPAPHPTLTAPKVIDGIRLNYPCDPLSGPAQGNWVLAYNQPYSDVTTASDIIQSSYSTTDYPVMCVAAYATSYASNATLIACGPRASVAAYTYSTSTAIYQASPGGDSGAYWYFYSGYSFGFSPSSSISLNEADTMDSNCDTDDDVDGSQRLSWYIDGSAGGYRAGCTTSLNSNYVWYKKIFVGAFSGSPSPEPTTSPPPTTSMAPTFFTVEYPYGVQIDFPCDPETGPPTGDDWILAYNEPCTQSYHMISVDLLFYLPSFRSDQPTNQPTTLALASLTRQQIPITPAPMILRSPLTTSLNFLACAWAHSRLNRRRPRR